MSDPVLSVDVTVDYPNKPDVLRNVCLSVERGEVLGLVGQSGSGKSTLALAILGLLGSKGARLRNSSVALEGEELTRLSQRELRRVRGRSIGFISQSPVASLNPMLRIGRQLEEAWRAHAAEGNGLEVIRAALESVSLPSDQEFLRRRPSQLSVGQAQRVLIAMAVLHWPPVLIADEPTSALDMITQAEVLSLFGRLNRQLGTAILFISHDLASVASICHRVAILHGGEIVECETTDRVFREPRHPYTQTLIAAMPRSEHASALAVHAAVGSTGQGL